MPDVLVNARGMALHVRINSSDAGMSFLNLKRIYSPHTGAFCLSLGFSSQDPMINCSDAAISCSVAEINSPNANISSPVYVTISSLARINAPDAGISCLFTSINSSWELILQALGFRVLARQLILPMWALLVREQSSRNEKVHSPDTDISCSWQGMNSSLNYYFLRRQCFLFRRQNYFPRHEN